MLIIYVIHIVVKEYIMNIDYQPLARVLMELLEVNPTMIASEVGIGRTNIYSWLKGKQRTLSEQSVAKLMECLGISADKLSRKIVHRWRANSVESVKLCLDALFPSGKLASTEIIQVNCDSSGYFNILRIPDSELGDTTIMVSPASQLSTGTLISSRTLGFGRDMKGIELDISQWNKWWNIRPLLTAHEFWLTAEPFLNLKVKPTFQGKEDESVDPQLLKTSYEKVIIEKTAENAGLRAIIRSVLRELRAKDPGNEWLNDDRRKWIYDEFYRQEMEKFHNPS